MRVWWDNWCRTVRLGNEKYPNGKRTPGGVEVRLDGVMLNHATYASEEEGYVLVKHEGGAAGVKRGKVSILPAKQTYVPIYELGSHKPHLIPGKTDGTVIRGPDS